MRGLILRPPPAQRAALARSQRAARAFCVDVGRLAVRSLYDELRLFPKPGLVSLVDSGSHADMNAATFLRSLFALRHYFVRITRAGMEGAGFAILKRLGIAAEQRMLAATGGINTHRGAIFSLGMLCASAGHCAANDIALSAPALRAAMLGQWGTALALHAPATDSHGSRVAAIHRASGAREEAALGLPSVFEVALPMFERALAAGRSRDHALVDALFALMAHISDTNVFHRGGAHGMAVVRLHAQQFLMHGGSAHPDWLARAVRIHRAFVGAGLSPGGAADLLAATCLVHALTQRGLRA